MAARCKRVVVQNRAAIAEAVGNPKLTEDILVAVRRLVREEINSDQSLVDGSEVNSVCFSLSSNVNANASECECIWR